MARQLEVFEFIEGIRDSVQVLYDNQIYNNHLNNIVYRCQVKTCASLITIDKTTNLVIKAPTTHVGHEPLSDCRVAVIREIKKMKERAKNDTTVSIKSIYEEGIKHLQNDKWKLQDVQAPLIGGLLPFVRFRGTLTTIRGLVVPELPDKLADMDFGLEKYKKYSLTNEGELFLRYDNKNNTKRILVFMSQCGIDWLRESLKNHGDGTFSSAPVFFFNFILYLDKRTK